MLILYVPACNPEDARILATEVARGNVPKMDHYVIRSLAISRAKDQNEMLRVPVGVYLVYTTNKDTAVVKARLPLD